jgi:hypothetical protein
MVPDMSDKVFGLSVNQVMAYAAIANVILVLVLVSINMYYAWHAKRQADASSAQVDTANRQREIAAETLSILRKQIEQQRTADLATVGLQLRLRFTPLKTGLSESARLRFRNCRTRSGFSLLTSVSRPNEPMRSIQLLGKTWAQPRSTPERQKPTSEFCGAGIPPSLKAGKRCKTKPQTI